MQFRCCLNFRKRNLPFKDKQAETVELSCVYFNGPYMWSYAVSLLNVFQMSDKSIALMRSRLRYFYLRIHFCPLTKIIKMYSGEDYQQFPLAPPFFPQHSRQAWGTLLSALTAHLYCTWEWVLLHLVLWRFMHWGTQNVAKDNQSLRPLLFIQINKIGCFLRHGALRSFIGPIAGLFTRCFSIL